MTKSYNYYSLPEISHPSHYIETKIFKPRCKHKSFWQLCTRGRHVCKAAKNFCKKKKSILL